MPLHKYIAETLVHTNQVTGQSIELVQNQEYDINIRHDGPQMIINGQPVIHPDSTVWVILQGDEGQIQLPYAPSCLSRQWEGFNL